MIGLCTTCKKNVNFNTKKLDKPHQIIEVVIECPLCKRQTHVAYINQQLEYLAATKKLSGFNERFNNFQKEAEQLLKGE